MDNEPITNQSASPNTNTPTMPPVTNRTKSVEILSDVPAVVSRALTLVVEKIQAAIAQQNQCTIALSGGSTPKLLYEALATQTLPWDKLQIFWGDERYVPPDHPDSNQRMTRQAWLDHITIPATCVHPMPTDDPDPRVAAAAYETEIRQVFQTPAPQIPTFDIVLLGMGDDGHTASLFPFTEALHVRDRLVTVGNRDGQPRLTLTVPVINQAACIIFIVTGSGKQSALTHVFAEQDDDLQYPSRLICPQGELTWLLDAPLGQILSS